MDYFDHTAVAKLDKQKLNETEIHGQDLFQPKQQVKRDIGPTDRES